MRYVQVIDGILECYQWQSDGKDLSTVVVLEHNYSAQEFTEALRKAADWYERVSKNQAKPEKEFHSNGRGHRRKQPRKKHCKAGHPRSKKNTYVRPDGRGECRICIKLRQRRK